MGLAGEVKERGGGDAGTSATTSDAEIARNPHQPEGWRRDGGDFLCRELNAVALATNITVFIGTKH